MPSTKISPEARRRKTAEATAPQDPYPFSVGERIQDALVIGEVLQSGTFMFGRMPIHGYRIRILSGHQKNQESIISRENARPA